MSKELKALEEMLEIRHLRTAMRKEDDLETAREEAKEAGTECGLHLLVLVPINVTNPELIYVHPQRFLNELDKLGQTLNMQTLQLEDIEETVEETAKEVLDTVEEKQEESPDLPGLDKLENYTKKELGEMSKAKLLKIAGIDPDVNTKGVKAELIKKLTGRPKFPLE